MLNGAKNWFAKVRIFPAMVRAEFYLILAVLVLTVKLAPKC
jgi:hypothetical protein